MARFDVGGETVLAAEFVRGSPVGACPSVLADLEGTGPDPDRALCPDNGTCIDDALAVRLFEDHAVTDLQSGNLLRSEDGTIWIIDLF